MRMNMYIGFFLITILATTIVACSSRELSGGAYRGTPSKSPGDSVVRREATNNALYYGDVQQGSVFWGRTADPNEPALYAEGMHAVKAYGQQNGIVGWGKNGVVGISGMISEPSYGVIGLTFGEESQAGVIGVSPKIGVRGVAEGNNPGDIGVVGEGLVGMYADGGTYGIRAKGNTGVHTQGDFGVHAVATHIGIFSQTTQNQDPYSIAVFGMDSNGYAVYGLSLNDGIGVYGQSLGDGLAGKFVGEVAITEGIIMESPNGNMWKITVSDTGEIVASRYTGMQNTKAAPQPDLPEAGEGITSLTKAKIPMASEFQ